MLVTAALHFFFNLGSKRCFKKNGHLIFRLSVTPKVVGTLCAHLPLRFYADSFENSHVFWSLSEDVHMIGI